MTYISKIFMISIIYFLILGCSGKENQLFQNKKNKLATTKHCLTDSSSPINAASMHIEKSDFTQYTIKKHDRLSLYFFSYPELSTRDKNTNIDTGIEVSDMGTIRLPIIGNIHIEGLTKDELQEKLYQDYKPYLEKEPTFTLKILNQKIYVLGEVNNVGPIDYAKQSSLTPIKAIVESGGLTNFAASDKIIIIRGTQENYKLLKLDLTDIGSIAKNNIVLKPNDIIYVSHTKMKDINVPLNGLNPSTTLINTIFQSIFLYRAF